MKQKKRIAVLSILITFTILISSIQSQNILENIEEKTELSQWYNVKQVADNVWCINDHGSDNIYLVAGDKKALLIDTGIGVADLDKIIKTLTDLPIIVVNTHAHPDHCGGNFQFKEVFAHPLDFDMIKEFSGSNYHDGNIEYVLNEHPDFEKSFIKDISDIELPHLQPITAGYVFDLGNRQLEVMEVPGHTKGSIVLLDTENKLLITGDNNNTMVWLFLDGCLPLETYLQSLQKLTERTAEFTHILPGHGDVLDKSILDELTICTQNIINGSCIGKKYDSFAGSGLVCSYKNARVAYNPDNIFVEK